MSDFIFQSVPQRFDLSALESPLMNPQRWQATRYRRYMHPGDGVFFYMSGPKAGIYGCGQIIAAPEEETLSVLVQWKHLYPSRISRNQLEPILKENLLFTVKVGTNFLLSPDESTALRSLITTMGWSVP